MKVVLEMNEGFEEDLVIIKCRQFNEDIQRIQKLIIELEAKKKELVVYNEETEYYLALNKILFFETDSGEIVAHTTADTYMVKYKLYELERLLPDNFIRISKSAILNVALVYAVNRGLTSSGSVAFLDSHKQVFVSRSYYKSFRYKLDEKRL